MRKKPGRGADLQVCGGSPDPPGPAWTPVRRLKACPTRVRTLNGSPIKEQAGSAFLSNPIAFHTAKPKDLLRWMGSEPDRLTD